MKILTKKKQKEIIDTITEIGIRIAEDKDIDLATFRYINERCYDLTSAIGGLDAVDNYYKTVDYAITKAEMGVK